MNAIAQSPRNQIWFKTHNFPYLGEIGRVLKLPGEFKLSVVSCEDGRGPPCRLAV